MLDSGHKSAALVQSAQDTPIIAKVTRPVKARFLNISRFEVAMSRDFLLEVVVDSAGAISAIRTPSSR